MTKSECLELLRWALPRLRLRWPGFRRVHRQVCRRIQRRMDELGVDSPAAYRSHLDRHPEEWAHLDAMCRIPISRFFRDRGVFTALQARVLPALARQARDQGRDALRAWSAGCASGEEPYSLAILWRHGLATHLPGVRLCIVATDADPHLLERARSACYPWSSLKEMPPALRAAAFTRSEGVYCLQSALRQEVYLRRQDIRREQPEGLFDLILCRNLAFTYFEPALQRDVLARMLAHLRNGGALVIGSDESLPEDSDLSPWPGIQWVYGRDC